jgi:hypothetical protein
MSTDQHEPLLKPQSRRASVKEEVESGIKALKTMNNLCCAHENSRLYCAFCGVLFALVLGGVVFSLLEKTQDLTRLNQIATDKALIMKELKGDEKLYNFIANHSNAFKYVSGVPAQTHWDIDDGMFFSLMIITTLGIAQEFPKTVGGHIFCALYALCCIPLMGLFLMLLGRRIVSLISYCLQCCSTCHSDTNDRLIQETFDSFDLDKNGTLDMFEFRNALKEMGVDNMDDDKVFHRIIVATDVDGDGHIDIDEFKLAVKMLDADLTGPSTKAFRLRIVFVLAFTWLAFGTAIFSVLERWRLDESFYFSVTVLTAIGTGDYVPHTKTGYMLFAIFVLMGLGVFSTILTIIATHYRAMESSIFDGQLAKRERLVLEKKKQLGNTDGASNNNWV